MNDRHYRESVWAFVTGVAIACIVLVLVNSELVEKWAFIRSCVDETYTKEYCLNLWVQATE